jgi:hypothetical protein
MAHPPARTRHAGFRTDRVAIAGALAVSVGVACGVRPDTGPVEPAWDRDTCERCAMILSDRRFAAQLRYAQDPRVHHFDDLGCALLAWDEGEAAGQTLREIWVRDRERDAWLDARSARFLEDPHTPMGYGFAAVGAAREDALDLESVRRRVREFEHERRRRGR